MEGAVIVGSILLAFGIDAAWEGREEAERREVLLAAIGSDMGRAREEVDRVAGFHGFGRTAATDLLRLSTETPLTESEARVADSLVAAVFSTATYDAPMGAVESLLGSGGLNILGDPRLTLALTAFPALVADLVREQAQLTSLADDLAEYLGDQGVDVALLAAPGFDVPWETGQANVSSVVASPRFRGIVSHMWYRYSNTTSDLETIRAAISQIDSLLPSS